MNIRIIKYIFISFLIAACSNYQKENSTKNNSINDSKASTILKNKNIEDGVYYIYKSCKYESESSKPKCNQDEVEIWSPLEINDNYVVRLNTSFDDFYLIKKGESQEVYFYSNFIENPISGWFKAKLNQNSSGFVLSRDSYFQSFGYKNDGSFDELPVYPYENMDYIPISDKKESYKVDENELINFMSYEGEYYIDCENYEKINSNIGGELSVSCYEKDALWLKKVK